MSNANFSPESVNLLLRHGYLPLLAPGNSSSDMQTISTLMMNLSYYGYALNIDAFNALQKTSLDDLIAWWKVIEPELKNITGEDRKIGDFVVYKNFPDEVLSKSDAEYWGPQILMYWGFPSSFFTEPVKPREKMDEQPKNIVFKNARTDTFNLILDTYFRSPARWKKQELKDVLYLSSKANVNLAHLVFKENMVQLATSKMNKGEIIKLTSATDVLRLAAGLSDGDVSLREKVKFKSFKKPVRKFLLKMLESCNNLSEDFARRNEVWKRLIYNLHPGDYKKRFPKVIEVMNNLYKDQLETFNSKVEKLIVEKDKQVLALLSDRPGEFRRRLAHMIDLFGNKAAHAFVANGVFNKLTTYQLVALRKFLETANHRNSRVFPPKGNWNKLQMGANRKVDVKSAAIVINAIDRLVAERLPKIKKLDDASDMIKLPNNGGDTSMYTRGTVFPIPDNVKFIRTASYWKNKGTVWFDNGWNFFDANWSQMGACCWDRVVNYKNGAAVFSGDPVNSKEMEGRAAQMIDLYPEKLKAAGVRYAVWNILCYSRIAYSDVEEVYAALQWGEEPMKGGLFEPSRCQLSFPLTGKQMTKFICLLDLEKNEMIYLDANLKGQVDSASSNCITLQTQMPAFMEYINSLPSVYDLFRESVDEKTGDINILYSDKDIDLGDNVPAYVFKPENKTNTYLPVNINALL